MPDAPQIASFHVDAVAAQPIGENIRLLLRTKEVAPFALIFPPMIAAQIGVSLEPLHPGRKRGPARSHKPGRAFAPGREEQYKTILRKIREIGPSACVARVCRSMVPPVEPTGFYSWRNRQPANATA